jgi:hypothetical protein
VTSGSPLLYSQTRQTSVDKSESYATSGTVWYDCNFLTSAGPGELLLHVERGMARLNSRIFHTAIDYKKI